jgi:polyisoprenoid-binding protein YceI
MAHLRFAALALAAVLALPACDDPKGDAPQPPANANTAIRVPKTPVPMVSAARLASSVTLAAPAPGDGLPLDAASASVGFVGSKVTGKHEGKFEKVSGWITLSGGKPEGGKLVIEVDVASVKTDSEKLDGHLKSPDLLDVGKYPKAIFTSTEIKAGGTGGATHTVTGDLELHGEKKTLTFPATFTVTPDAVSGTAEVTLNRREFKVNYPGMPNDLIKDEVPLKLSLRAARPK